MRESAFVKRKSSLNDGKASAPAMTFEEKPYKKEPRLRARVTCDTTLILPGIS